MPPLDPDPDSNGKPADHLMVLMSPISAINNRPARAYKKISWRPLSEEGMRSMQQWLCTQDWSEVSQEESAHKKAEIIQYKLLSKYEEYFPVKVKTVSSDDQPFVNEKLKRMKRKKCREYRKHRRSSKWKLLDVNYQNEVEKLKKGFYSKKIKNLRKCKPGKWHSELKKITSYDQQKSEEIIVESIKDLSISDQAELIADSFSAVKVRNMRS